MLDKLKSYSHSFLASSVAEPFYAYFRLDVKDYESKVRAGRRFIRGVDSYDIPIHLKRHLNLPLSKHKSESFKFRENITDLKNHLGL